MDIGFAGCTLMARDRGIEVPLSSRLNSTLSSSLLALDASLSRSFLALWYVVL